MARGREGRPGDVGRRFPVDDAGDGGGSGPPHGRCRAGRPAGIGQDGVDAVQMRRQSRRVAMQCRVAVVDGLPFAGAVDQDGGERRRRAADRMQGPAIDAARGEASAQQSTEIVVADPAGRHGLTAERGDGAGHARRAADVEAGRPGTILLGIIYDST